MNPARKPFRLNAILVLLILGLAAFIIYIYFFINPSEVLGVLSKTNLTIYAGAFIAYFAFAFFSSLVWHQLLSSLSIKISRRKTLLFTWAGLFFDATIPQLGWSGDVSKTYLLAKDSKVDAGKIGASVVGQKIFTMTLTIAALSIGLGLVLANYALPLSTTLLIAAVLVLSILALVVVYLVSIRPAATKTLLRWAIRIGLFFRKRWNPKNFQVRAEALLDKFHGGFKQLAERPEALAKAAVFAVLSFIFEVSVLFLTFAALGYPVPVDKVLIVFTLTGTLQTVGITFFGFPELIMTVSFSALLIPASLALSVTLLARVVNLWFRLIVSYTALQWAGIKILRQNPSA
ncbi:MAG TPA: lysylphosphatidylglycerol synthase transmembrane domain-containing protein [Candidatus Binatia bacterium]|nr:lysylphosphatidylglycerol synthase transmembrane domain-containing protein [Candidatus Binatia bacterium]